MREIRATCLGIIKAQFKRLSKQAAIQITEARKTVIKAEKDEIEAILAELDLSWDDLTEQMQSALVAMTKDGVKQAMTQLSLSNAPALNQANQKAIDWAKNRSAEMIGKKWVDGELVDNPDAKWRIDESTRDMLRSTVREAIEQGLSNEALANNIEESYAFSIDRARTIARTETAMADVEGNIMAYQQANAMGIPVWKKWITAEDDKVSPDCAENGKAKARPMDEEFPSGVLAPPDHPNCRCDVLPVVMQG